MCCDDPQQGKQALPLLYLHWRAVQVTMCGRPYQLNNPRDVVLACGAMPQLTRLLRELRKTGPSAIDLAGMWTPIEHLDGTVNV
jgi:hypothetical protein